VLTNKIKKIRVAHNILVVIGVNVTYGHGSGDIFSVEVILGKNIGIEICAFYIFGFKMSLWWWAW
jgi:hypothetical protein